jgi:hypothetical protein
LRNIKNKTKISAITFVLILTISAILVALPTATAHDPPWEIPTYSFVALVPNDYSGVGQQVVVVYWLNLIMPTAVGAYGDRWTQTVEVTKPDGSKQTLGPATSDPVGGGWFLYTPDQVGTYTFVAQFPGQVLTGEPAHPTNPRGTDYINDKYLASTSDPAYLIVQQDSKEPFPEAPLPTEYWERPIYGANRGWSQVAANWLAGAAQRNGPTNSFQWGTGPETAHIMWSTPMWSGGVMDARFGPIGYQTHHYHGLAFSPPIIIDGKIFYNVRSYPRYGWRCLDLYTGEERYFHNTTGPVVDVHGRFDSPGYIRGGQLSFGQIYDYESGNQHGGFPYLISTYGPDGQSGTWQMFDAYTGNYLCSIANVSSSGTQVYGKEGSIVYYNVDTRNNRLTVWNNTYAIWYEDEWSSNEFWMWRPDLNATFDGNNGFALNVSIADWISGRVYAIREGEFIIGGSEGRYNDEELTPANLWCLSLERGQEGTVLWNLTITPPYGVPAMALQEAQYSSRDVEMSFVSPEDNVFVFNQEMTRQWWGYDLTTGEQIWGPTPSEEQMNFYGMRADVYDGKLLSTGYSGQIIAYNLANGEIEWVYNATGVGFEAPYGNYPIRIGCICDGKIYAYTSEHSDTHPLYRGPNLRCIDAETGEEIWKILWFNGAAKIADGFLVAENSFDNSIYCIGKGPSSTTVTVQDDVIPKGDKVLIKGKVTDQAPGAKSREVMAKSPNEEGVPCIADEYMTEWMEYLYLKQSCPTYAEGVEVTLDAVDPNGNFVNIGRTTSDMSGLYSFEWTPENEGKYTIMATFEGSKSYWPSYSETAISVGPAAAPSGPIEPEPTEPTEAPLITTEVAILLAAVIVAVAVIVGFWIVRKRK